MRFDPTSTLGIAAATMLTLTGCTPDTPVSNGDDTSTGGETNDEGTGRPTSETTGEGSTGEDSEEESTGSPPVCGDGVVGGVEE